VKALVDAGFNVTALTRIDSKSLVPSGVKVHKTDYNSAASIAETFKGQDAVVSTIATAALGQQQTIIDEAVKAGVKRFIPSEYGVDTTKISGGVAKILGAKLAAQAQLKKAAEENSHFSWTGISTGLFFEWVS
jgi:putative NADH-flavin reductase